MAYDFVTRVNRAEAGSSKWEAMAHLNPQLGSSIVPLSVADMELVNPPEIQEALKDYIDANILGYTNPTKEFFNAVVSWQKNHHQWSPEPEWIVTSPGVVPALFQAIRSFTKEGDGIIIQPPVYYPFERAVRLSNRTLVENPLKLVHKSDGSTHYEIDFEDLATKAAQDNVSAMILCSPHNPVGRVWTPTELRRVVDICVAHNLMLICDEIHNDLIMPGHEHTTLFNVVDQSEYQQVMVACAPSKTFNIAGCQASTIFIPDEQRRKAFCKGQERIPFNHLNALAYPATIAAYTRCDAWLKELLALIWDNYQLVRGTIEGALPGVKVFPLEGTYLAWVDFRAWKLSNEELETFMTKDALLFLDEGYIFGDEGSGFERINLACPRAVLSEALDRLIHAAHERGFDRRSDTL